MEHSSWLINSLIYLAAAVIAVPLSKALGLGSIIGYLAAGIAIGPWGLKLVTDVGSILQFAEFGVVLMLFLVGLELDPKRLWEMRKPIFGAGSAQMISCTVLLMAVGGMLVTLMDWPLGWKVLLVAALGLSLSSTAIALQVLGERNELRTSAGQSAFSVSLFQDISAIPILALLPLLAAQSASAQAGGAHIGLEALKAIGVIAGVMIGGRLILRRVLRWIAASRTPEIFTAASLLLVVAIAALMQWVGLSMALGAFLAGVLLAESEYRRELETDIEPFKGLLLGLFFIAVGMSIDFAVLLKYPLVMVALVVAFMSIKALAVWQLARFIKLPYQDRPVFTLMLAQGSEFAFVVFQQATGLKLLTPEMGSILVGAVALSMLLSPLVLVLIDRWVLPRYADCGKPAMDEINEAQHAPVIVAGCGRYGQIVLRVLAAKGYSATVLDHDPEQIEGILRFGYRVFYGDATRLDLLRTAGAASAKVLIVAVDDVEQSLEIVDACKAHFPGLQLVVRARNVQHYYQLRARGVTLVQRETFESALLSAEDVMMTLGHTSEDAHATTARFKAHNLAQLETAWPHHQDQERLISIAKAGRQQLEELMAQEREVTLLQPDAIAHPPLRDVASQGTIRP
jgi:glutathione-regulated potassium-efflux system ancillary protein KefC